VDRETMTQKYFALRNPYKTRFGSSQWTISFPPWTESEFDFYSTEAIGAGWNPGSIAFSSTVVIPGSPPVDIAVKPDFPSVVGEWHAASRKMQDVLNRVAPGCVEFLPFRTMTSTGNDATDMYALMHYLQWSNAVDSKASRLMEGETRLRRVAGIGKDYLLDHVVLKRSKLTEPVCRIVGWSPMSLYREDVVAALAKEKITGLDFEEIVTS